MPFSSHALRQVARLSAEGSTALNESAGEMRVARESGSGSGLVSGMMPIEKGVPITAAAVSCTLAVMCALPPSPNTPTLAAGSAVCKRRKSC
eukprot:scaffold26118_cov29-Tisochrysis_lutea.AAC.3